MSTQIHLLLLFILVINHQACPQALKVGDRLPPLVFQNIYNYSSDTLAIPGSEEKAIVLDFWNSYCLPCLQAFPKIDSLQHEFAEEVQFIAVSKMTHSETSSFFESRPFVHRPEIPFITADSVLHNLFPHIGLPFQVWIDSDGVVRGFTSGKGLTGDNIKKVIDGSSISAAKKIAIRETLFDNAFFNQNVLFASYLVRQPQEVRLVRPQAPNSLTLSGSIPVLYKSLYTQAGQLGFDPFQVKRTTLDKNISDSSEYQYQCIIPADFKGDLFSVISEDFERYFSIKPSVEKRWVKCLVLRRVDNVDRLHTKGAPYMHTFYAQDVREATMADIRQYINGPYDWLSASIAAHLEYLTGLPFIDDTGYSGNVDLVFKGETLDNPSLAAFRSELEEYGLSLSEEKRLIEVLVLKGD